jgi:hydroxyethylthiazole kinase-like uncharacterized protein yjeF
MVGQFVNIEAKTMTELLTAAQMRAIEEAAIASGEVTGLELMERAGRGVVEAIFEEWPELAKTSHRAVVLCGPGNNGGDGFVVARLLKEWGWEVEVFLYGDPEKLPPDARANYERWCGMGEVTELSGREMDSLGIIPDLVIDAIFGTGQSREIPWPLADAVQLLATTFLDGVPVASIDIPTGLSADTGREFPVAEGPKEWSCWKKFAPCAVLGIGLTITFHKAKRGLFLSQGPLAAGKVVVKDIGLRNIQRGASAPLRPRPAPEGGGEIAPTLGSGATLGEEDTQVSLVDGRALDCLSKRSTHKYTHGHALILSGGASKGGAARLAARGALRIGAGLVTVGCPPDALAENAARLDAVMLKPIADADAFGRVLEDSRINALCLGPGLGTGERKVALVAAALGVGKQRAAPDSGGARSALPGGGSGAARRTAGRSLVLDADALTILAREPDLFGALHDGCVLTPHAGEFARLFPDIAEKLAAPATKGPAYSKVDATREAAKRAGCVVLYKGPDTVIADPSGRCSINSAHYDRAAPWLATAGSGDVLAGFITGLLARGLAPMPAAETAAWLHVECALKFGPGLIAEDLPEQLPAVFRDLGL